MAPVLPLDLHLTGGFILTIGPVRTEKGAIIEVTIQYFEGCHGWEVTERRLREVLGRDAVIEFRRVESHEEAVRLGFRGSPTVLLDGVDPFAEPEAPVGLACRIYRTEAGPEDAPSVEQLRTVLGAAS
jgi:hypothetical protein